MVMKYASVSELKAKLSEHLCSVRAGEAVVVLDRRRPVAQMVPVGEPGNDVRISEPTASAATLRAVKPVRPRQ